MPRLTQTAIQAAINNGIALPTSKGDTTAPTITSITAAAGSYRSGTTVDFTVTFSEALTTTAIASSTLGLTVGTNATKTAAQVASTSTTITYRYTVQAGDTDTDGITVTGLNLNGATIRDVAGNTTVLTIPSSSQTFASVLVDTTPPTTPAIDAVETNDVIDAVEVKDGVTVSGAAAVGTKVTLTSGTTTLGTATVAAPAAGATTGPWSFALNEATITALGQGDKTLTLTSTDTAGNSASVSRPVTIDTTAPAIGVVADNDIVNADEATKGFSVTGAATPGASVVLRNQSNAEIGTATATGGTWTIPVNKAAIDAMDQGSETLTVTATAAGATSTASRSITVDTAPPVIDLGKVVTAGDDVVTKAESTAVVVTGANGAVDPSANVTVSITDGTAVKSGTAKADGNGGFSVAGLDVSAFKAGTLTVTVKAVDAAGNEADKSEDVFYRLSPTLVAQSTTLAEGDAALSYQVVAAPAAGGSAITKFEITAGNTGGLFAIGEKDGKITLTRALDVDPAPGKADALKYELTVKATDNQAQPQSETAVVTINVTDVNDSSPVFTSANTKTISEATKVGDKVLDVVAADGDLTAAFNTVTYSIVSGNTKDAFAIDAKTGALTVKSALDFETTSKYDLVVRAADGTGTGAKATDQTVTVTVSDVNDAPVATTATFTVEDDGKPDVLTTAVLKVTDEDTGNDAIFFKLESVNPTTPSATLGLLIDRNVISNPNDDTDIVVGAMFSYADVVNQKIAFRESATFTSGTIVLVMTDGKANPTPAAAQTLTIPVTILAVNNAPEIWNEGALDETTALKATTVSETAAATPFRIDETLTIVDRGTTDFTGGFLTVSVDDSASGTAARAGDRLTVATAGGIAVSAGSVTFNGAVIGGIDGTLNGVYDATTNPTAALKINLAGIANAPVSRGAVEALVEAIAFSTTDQTTKVGVDGSRTVTFLLNDGEGLPKEGTNTAAITITGVNTAPTLTVGTAAQTTKEDTALTVTGLSVADPDSASVSVTLGVTEAGKAGGTLAVTTTTGAAWNGTTGVLSGSVAAVSATLASGLTYTPTKDFFGATELTVTLKDETDLAATAQKIAITVTSDNDLPTAKNGTVVAREGGTYTFKTADFGFADVESAGPTSVTIVSRAGIDPGTLRLDGKDVTDGQVIAAADVGKLVYAAPASANGAPFDDFTFKVTDADGGTSTATYKMNVDVTAKPTVSRNADLILGGGYSATENSNVEILGLSINDMDSDVGMRLRLSVDFGTLTTGNAITDGDDAFGFDVNNDNVVDVTLSGKDTNAVTLSGSEADINTVLSSANIVFSAGTGVSGSGTLTAVAFDGPDASDNGPSKTYSIAIAAVSNEYAYDPNNTQSYFGKIGDAPTRIYDVATGSELGLAISGFGSGDGGMGLANYDTLTIYDTSASAVTYAVAGGNTTLTVGANTITLVQFTDSLDGGRVAFTDGSVLRTNTGSSPTLLVGGGGADQLVAGSGGDTLRGGNGGDKLVGGVGVDFLYGGGGGDTLIGGAGGDRFFGGTGADTMYANTQAAPTGALSVADLFVYRLNEPNPGFVTDQIHGFEFQIDKIVLSNLINFTQADYDSLALNNKITVTDDGVDTTIDFANSATIKLMGVTGVSSGDYDLFFAGGSILNNPVS